MYNYKKKYRYSLLINFILSFIVIFTIFVDTFAGVYLNFGVKTKVKYIATEIGAEVFGVYALTVGGDTEYKYLQFEGESIASVENNIYTVDGNDKSYGINVANIPDVTFTDGADGIVFYIFMKNNGVLSLTPNITVVDTTQKMNVDKQNNYFDNSLSHTDIITTFKNQTTAKNFVNVVDSLSSETNYTNFPIYGSIGQNSTYYQKTIFSIPQGTVTLDGEFTLDVTVAADLAYVVDTSNILSIRQNIANPTSVWEKIGYNATVGTATATKFDTSSMEDLITAYKTDGDRVPDGDGNRGSDPYLDEVVYKDIDLVNVDINTGEIIGKLSNVNYSFEWYGGVVTLPTGTELASGRVLEESDEKSFTVDVYTYYPNIYVRRYRTDSYHTISISDQDFYGAVLVPEHYTATFTAVLYNPDKTTAMVGNKIVPRSYANDILPLVNGAGTFLNTYYSSDYENITTSPTQTQMLAWSNNLTTAWNEYATSKPTMVPYTTAVIKGCQGENWTRFVYNLLYLVKYANNDSQDMVGQGNVYTHNLYNSYNGTITQPNGEIETEKNGIFNAEKGATIGLYDSTLANTNGYNEVGMNYGYKSMVYESGVMGVETPTTQIAISGTSATRGLSPLDFLVKTETIGESGKRILRDGYVGTDGYTSVFCLGICNPWGNVWTWMFGGAVTLNDDGTANAYINFEDSSTYYTQNNRTTFENSEIEKYSKLTYLLPNSNGWYNYTGISQTTSENNEPLASLIGMPDSNSAKGSQLTDYYWVNTDTSALFGVVCGGDVDRVTRAGALACSVHSTIAYISTDVGFRPLLIS